MDRLQRRGHLIVRLLTEPVEGDGTFDEPVGQAAGIPGLLSLETDLAEPLVAECQERLWRHLIDRLSETCISGVSRGKRHLLFQNEPHHGGESWISLPQRWYSVPIPEDSEGGLDLGEMSNAVGQGVCIYHVERRGVRAAGLGQSRFSLMRVALPTRSRRK